MLDEMYTQNLKKAMDSLENLPFPELLRGCRELMGLKQYACADYLGFENDRYRKIELGNLKEPLESWEMERLEKFFQLEKGVLQSKQKEYIQKTSGDRKGVCQNVWSTDESTRGARAQRTAGNYRRVSGSLEA